MASNMMMTYNIDIVMCIDATGSMTSLLNLVKRNALNFSKDLRNTMENLKIPKHIDELRVRIVAFRDYIADGKDAMLATDFFNLPDESADLESVLKELKPFGGGDEPEDGLEALAYAIKSDWTKSGTKQRHIIVVWTDDATHPLGFGSKAPNYPSGMPRDFEELTEWWGDKVEPGLMDYKAKRLLIFAPDYKYWSTISDNWDNVIHFPSEAGKGLEGLEYNEILNVIANSV